MRERLAYSESLFEVASMMTLYTSTSLQSALMIPRSDLEAFFEGKPFENWKKQKEIEAKNFVGVCDRLNEIIRGCNAICKTIARAR